MNVQADVVTRELAVTFSNAMKSAVLTLDVKPQDAAQIISASQSSFVKVTKLQVTIARETMNANQMSVAMGNAN